VRERHGLVRLPALGGSKLVFLGKGFLIAFVIKDSCFSSFGGEVGFLLGFSGSGNFIYGWMDD
jgi:hypothetical protein